MTSATGEVYCWTCRKTLTAPRWERHIQSIGHVRRALGDPPPFVQPKMGQPAAEAAEPDEADTPTPCAGCSRRITPGAEYWRDNGLAFHNGCVPLATTRPLDPTQTAQAAPQQDSTLVAGVGVQLGAGTGEEAPSPTQANDDQGKPEHPLARLARDRREARARNG